MREELSTVMGPLSSTVVSNFVLWWSLVEGVTKIIMGTIWLMRCLNALVCDHEIK